MRRLRVMHQVSLLDNVTLSVVSSFVKLDSLGITFASASPVIAGASALICKQAHQSHLKSSKFLMRRYL